MSYYLLPHVNKLTYKYIDCVERADLPVPAISNSLSTYLYEIKEKLNNCSNEWDVYKKYTNPYEYIHTVVPFKKKCISKHKPLSRSYFKMIELISMFNLQFGDKPICSFHLAEGPGGFIEALSKIRNSPNDQYVGMTILDDVNDVNIPAWKKTDLFLRQHKNVHIEKGADETGNILSLCNFIHCKDLYRNKMDLITADGGFDFSTDFNQQEMQIGRLLFAQMCFAITMQKLGGSFILKIFDCFMQHSIDIIYILSSFYERVYVAKPNTSRAANSEKYIICKGFLHSNCDVYFPYLYRSFEKMTACSANVPFSGSEATGFEENYSNPLYIHRYLTTNIPQYYLTKMEDYNAIFGQQQIENIHYTISLIDNNYKNDKIDNLIRINVKKCLLWCVKYNVEYIQL